MQVELKVSITVKELFNFIIKHTYSTFSGYIGVVISACALFGFIATFNNEVVTIQYKLVLIFTALLFTVIQPLTIYLKAKKQVEQNEAINKPLEYVFNDAKIKVSQGDESVEYDWNQVIKVTSSKISIFVYTSRYRALILPRDNFAEGDISKLRDLVRSKAVMVKSVNFGKVD